MRGIYEHPTGSGIWWIHYYAAGNRHREKVGRKSDAIKLYQSRKADAVAGRKLPELRNSKVVTVSELIDDVLEFVAHHKDNRNYKSRAAIVREALGSRHAAELTPQELERWLREHCKTAATANRYKAFVSLCYREGVRNGKVSVNPARLVRQRKEGTGRLRFLSRDEYDRLHKVLAKRFPCTLAGVCGERSHRDAPQRTVHPYVVPSAFGSPDYRTYQDKERLSAHSSSELGRG